MSSSGPLALTSSAPVRHSTVPFSQNGRPVATAAVRAQEKPKSPEMEKMSCFCRLGMAGWRQGGWASGCRSRGRRTRGGHHPPQTPTTVSTSTHRTINNIIKQIHSCRRLKAADKSPTAESELQTARARRFSGHHGNKVLDFGCVWGGSYMSSKLLCVCMRSCVSNHKSSEECN